MSTCCHGILPNTSIAPQAQHSAILFALAARLLAATTHWSRPVRRGNFLHLTLFVFKQGDARKRRGWRKRDRTVAPWRRPFDSRARLRLARDSGPRSRYALASGFGPGNRVSLRERRRWRGMRHAGRWIARAPRRGR